MKKKFLKKLSAYSSFASLFLNIPKDINAQIIYTDLEPDVSLHNSTYNLDLNNDGIFDFILKEKYKYHRSVGGCSASFSLSELNSVMPQNQNKILAYSASGLPQPLIYGKAIDSTKEFTDKNILFKLTTWSDFNCFGGGGYGSHSEGLWGYPNNENFLGLKLVVNSKEYYGWARIKIQSKQLVISDYAINIKSNEQISAGQVDCSNFKTDFPGIEIISPNCENNSLTLKSSIKFAGTYQWFKNGSLLANPTPSTLLVNSPGLYEFKGYFNGCSDSSETNILMLPGDFDPQIFIHGDSILTTPIPGCHYSWWIGSIPLSNSDLPFLVTEFNGYYKVLVTDSYGCIKSSASIFYKFTSDLSISTANNNLNLLTFNRTLFLQNIPQEYLYGVVEVFDVTGRKSAGQTITGSSEQLHLSSLPDGLYILELSKSGLKERRKFVLN